MEGPAPLLCCISWSEPRRRNLCHHQAVGLCCIHCSLRLRSGGQKPTLEMPVQNIQHEAVLSRGSLPVMASDQLHLAAKATQSSPSQNRVTGILEVVHPPLWVGSLPNTLQQGLPKHLKCITLLKTRTLSAVVRLSLGSLQDARSCRLPMSHY